MASLRACLHTNWQESDGPSSTSSLHSGDVQIWSYLYSTATQADCERVRGWLTPEDLVSANRMVMPDHRDRAVLRRGFLRCVLAGHVGKEPSAVDLRVGRRGKPFVAGHETLSFSLSHTDDVVLLAVSRSMGVGVDVERVAADLDPGALVRVVFASEEMPLLAETKALEKKRAFLRVWCRKEACLKATGVGLLDDLTLLSVAEDVVDLGACKDRRVGPEDATILTVQDLALGDAHVGALATTQPCPKVNIRQPPKVVALE
jgi:phosphopantetheinyl transferase